MSVWQMDKQRHEHLCGLFKLPLQLLKCPAIKLGFQS